MDKLFKIFGNPNRYLGREEKICFAIKLILDDTRKLFNRLSSSQKNIIESKHKEINESYPIHKNYNLGFMCPNQILIEKIMFRYRDIYYLHEGYIIESGTKHRNMSYVAPVEEVATSVEEVAVATPPSYEKAPESLPPKGASGSSPKGASGSSPSNRGIWGSWGFGYDREKKYIKEGTQLTPSDFNTEQQTKLSTEEGGKTDLNSELTRKSMETLRNVVSNEDRKYLKYKIKYLKLKQENT